MRMPFLGCSHQDTPLSLVDRLAFSAEQARLALNRLRGEFPGVKARLESVTRLFHGQK